MTDPLQNVTAEVVGGIPILTVHKGSRLVCIAPGHDPVIVLFMYDAKMIAVENGMLAPVRDNGSRYLYVETARSQNLI